LFYALPGMRKIPLALARRLSEIAARNKAWLVVYTFGIFVLIPLAGILLLK
jgi:hypothetical protein